MLTLTEREDIRLWAAARGGNPAIGERDAGLTGSPVLRIVFDQYLLNAGESQYGDRPGGLELVSWDDWFAELDRQNLVMLVEEERPGVLDDYFEFAPRQI
jgi:hypothetical protein